MNDAAADRVARYYDSNTRRFLLLGGGGAAYSIHRLLWGPGVRSTSEAADYINRLLADRIAEVAQRRSPVVLDMGCGVGGTLFRLAELFPSAELHGITVSPGQHRIAARLAGEKGLDGRCRVHLGDLRSTRLEVEADAVLAVESFAHVPSADRFFAAAAQHLAPGGRVFLVDDFLAVEPERLSPGDRRNLDQFRTGWRIPGLSTTRACTRAAERRRLELVADDDLTPLVRLDRPRDRLLAIVGPVLGALGLAGLPIFGNMIGGNALRGGLRRGTLAYRLLTFQSVQKDGPH